ncbi:hypothetical protein HanPI659440_Chr17g0676081 [Helianthus annuus]|nr:hypothetical protein HanPI659440_Chr17g0676081 [Helianthus annuus]
MNGRMKYIGLEKLMFISIFLHNRKKILIFIFFSSKVKKCLNIDPDARCKMHDYIWVNFCFSFYLILIFFFIYEFTYSSITMKEQ